MHIMCYGCNTTIYVIQCHQQLTTDTRNIMSAILNLFRRHPANPPLPYGRVAIDAATGETFFGRVTIDTATGETWGI